MHELEEIVKRVVKFFFLWKSENAKTSIFSVKENYY